MALLFTFLVLTPSAQGAGAPASKPHGLSLQAFVLPGAPDSLADLRAHTRSLKVVYPTYFECAIPNGGLTGADSPSIDAYARQAHLTLMPRFNCQDPATVHTILTNPQTRTRLLAQLQRIAANPAYGGLNLDLENDGAADREALTAFVGELAGHLHAQGKKLAVDVDGVTQENPRLSTGFYDDRALAAEADTIFVIAWGTHWAGSVPGPIGSLPFVREVAAYVASLPNKRKFVLGVPMYGLDWPAGGGPEHQATAYQYTGVVALAHSVGATPLRDPISDELGFDYESDGVVHQVWYLDGQSIVDRLRVARAYGLAVGLWRLGDEDQGLWSSRTVAG
jgi:spore germination protein